jgi:hypothetical protein
MMVRAERKLIQMALHAFCRDVDVRARDGFFEPPPKTLAMVRVMRRTVTIVVVGELAGAIFYATMLAAVSFQ